MIRRCDEGDFEVIWSIVNDGAHAYQGVIPADRWKEPYMSRDELRAEIRDGVIFWASEENSEVKGVMGVQPVQDVTLIRHAYVRTANQRQGIGRDLLTHLLNLVRAPVLIGTWADAVWAIRFYERHGFRLVTPEQRTGLPTNTGKCRSARWWCPLSWPIHLGRTQSESKRTVEAVRGHRVRLGGRCRGAAGAREMFTGEAVANVMREVLAMGVCG